MKFHETRSQAQPNNSSEEEEKMTTKKQKAEHSEADEGEQSLKKAKKTEDVGKSEQSEAEEQEEEQSLKKGKKTEDVGKSEKREAEAGEQSLKKGKKSEHDGKSKRDIAMEFDKFCKATRKHLSIQLMRQILESNGQDASGSDDAVVPRCQDMMFYGPLKECPICGGKLLYNDDSTFTCNGSHSEWSSCIFISQDPPRKNDPIKLPSSIHNLPVYDLIKRRQQDSMNRPERECLTDKPFEGMVISLSERLSRKHVYWKSKIERYGGILSNSVDGATCLVLSPVERDHHGSGSSKVAKALEQGVPIVREAWLHDSIDKLNTQPLDINNITSDLSVGSKGIPLDKTGNRKEAHTADVKVYGKRGVHKDSKLHEKGGVILEKDGILYNCVLAVTDLVPKVNDFCVMQLIMMPDEALHLYFKKGRIGDDARTEEKLEQWKNKESAIKEFAWLFQELTGNEFEQWEREKKFKKKRYKFYPSDMADGMDARHGGVGLQQLEAAVAHTKLDPVAANLMKVLCSQEIYRHAIMELDLDLLDLPVGMLSDIHLKRCEDLLVDYPKILIKSESENTNQETLAWWGEISCRWFTLLPSSRPMLFRDFHDLADLAASTLETVRDISVASHLIGDMSDSTLDDPLLDRYKKLGCSVSSLDKDSDDYKMIVKYLETTYEPFQVGDVSYGVSIENILAVDPTAGPSYDEIKTLPNKYLLWCGTRTSNILRHLHKGFLPSICWLPQPGYMFGRSIVCSDASAEAAKYGFTSVARPDGFLILAVASLGDQITEYNCMPDMEEVVALQEKKTGVVGLGRKKTEESEHFIWKDDIKVPCGHLVSSEHKDSPLEYNEFATYGSKARICFMVEVKYKEVQNVC